MYIHRAQLRPLLDSRKEQTLEVVLTSGRFSVKASVPHGKSTGSHEAVALPFQEALRSFDRLEKELYRYDFSSQKDFDGFLSGWDGSEDKHVLGANTMLALSIAFARIMAREKKQEVFDYIYEEFLHRFPSAQKKSPYLVANLVNGGAHGSFSPAWRSQFHVSPLSFQEFHIIPLVDDVAVGLGLVQEFYFKLKRKLSLYFDDADIAMGDEAGFSAPFDSPYMVFDIFSDLIEQYHYPCGIGIDAAASEFYKGGRYVYQGKEIVKEELLSEYIHIIDTYPLLFLEDPFHEDDFDSFSDLFGRVKHEDLLIVGDDLTVTQLPRVAQASEQGAVNACIVKPNQVGTISEVLDVVSYMYAHGMRAVTSHRSGETLDTFIADLAVGIGAWGIKAGAPVRPERSVKYERLISIG